MKPLKNIVIGTSLGEESDQVVRSGLAMARAAGARAFLVHAAQLEPQLAGYEIGAGPLLELEQIARGEEELRRQIERLGAGGSDLAGSKVQIGAPHRILIRT